MKQRSQDAGLYFRLKDSNTALSSSATGLRLPISKDTLIAGASLIFSQYTTLRRKKHF
jgi:hypothetical protein